MPVSIEQPVVWHASLSVWTRTTLFWLMAVTVTGAVVRLTGSGLGCTDWPTCEVNTALDTPGYHAAIEFGNRIISGLAIVPLIAVWIASRAGRRDLLGIIWLLVAGFLGQVLLGMLVTRTELDPRVVLGHFLLSIVLIFLALALDQRANPTELMGERPLADTKFLLAHAWLVVALTTVVVVIGTLVTASGPHTGSDQSGQAIPRLGFAIREITRVHSVLVWVLCAALLWGLWSTRATDSFHRRRLITLTIAAALQGAIGYTQYFNDVPELLVGFHIAGAVALFAGVAVYAFEASRAHTEKSAVAAPNGSHATADVDVTA